MELEHEFVVPVGIAEAWQVLLDVERIAPCMPGASVKEVHGDAFTGSVKVKVGPITMTYTGEARFAEKDESARRVVVEAAGKENRGSGTAKATMTATLEPNADRSSTTARVLTDLTVTGRPAQFGRGMLQDVGGKLIGQFADNLAKELQAPQATAETAGGEPTEPASAQEASTQASGAAGSARAQQASRAGGASSPDALDLLEVTGVSGVVARYRAPIIAGAVVAGAAVFLLLRRRRSRR